MSSDDISTVGGKNASLGEMINTLRAKDVRVPDGFSTTADAYWKFMNANDLKQEIKPLLEKLENNKGTLKKVGKSIRRLFLRADFPDDIAARQVGQSHRKALRQAYGHRMG